MNQIQLLFTELEIKQEKEKIKHSELLNKAQKLGFPLNSQYNDLDFAIKEGILAPQFFS